MSLLDQIKYPVREELRRYEEYLRESLRSDHQMTQTMLSYIMESRGKAIRPLLVMLTAGMFSKSDKLPEDTMLAGMLVEMTHTASLVHDDVIDEAYTRRGKPSAKAMWRSHKAVLIGDYILAKIFVLSMESGSYDVVKYVMRAMMELVEGELMQSEQSDRLEMTRDIYYDIIYKKTASLIGTSSGVGAFSAGAMPEQVRAMRAYGDNLGMAFQIKDDLLDYTTTVNTGKPVCSDLRERKVTLPLLTVMEKSSESRRREIIRLLSDVRNNPLNADCLYDMVIEEGGMDMAAAIMREYVSAARKELETYPESPYKVALEELCTYMIDRNM